MLFKKTLKPYMLNAFYTWSIDLGFTPLIEVQPYEKNILPNHLINQNIILNIHHNATRNLVFGKDKIDFQARFDGNSYDITIYHYSIRKILNKEDKYGLDFDLELEQEEQSKKSKPKLYLVKNDNNV